MREINQKLIRKEYSTTINELLKYFELFKNENTSYTAMYNEIFLKIKKFDSNYENLETQQENKLVYFLVNIIEELPDEYFIFRSKQQELEDWAHIEFTENKNDFFDFVSKYPDFKFIDILQQKFNFTDDNIKDIEVWKNCVRQNTIDSYSEYQKNNCEGIFVKYADEKIDELKLNNKKEYLKNFALQEKYWNYVITENSVNSYTNYLKYFPDGINRINADLKLKMHSNSKNKDIEDKQKSKIIISKRTKIIAIATVAILLLIYSGTILFFSLKAESFYKKNETVKATNYNKTASEISFGLVALKTYYSVDDLALLEWWNSLDIEIKKRLFPDNYSKITTIEDIKGIINLETADLSGLNISDLSFLKPLYNIRSLDLSYTNISELSFISELKYLENLNISSTKVKDLSPLVYNERLTSLYCNYLSQIIDLTPLTELENLTKFFIHNTALENIEPISEMKSLTDINISHNNIQDISSLKKLPQLKYISCEYNPIQSIEILKELPNLKQIRIFRLDVCDEEIEDFVKKYNENYNTNLNVIMHDDIAMYEE